MNVTKSKPFLVNANPNYKFAELRNLPDTQLVMTLPRRYWERLKEYIATYEAVHLAGRFGADPGDFEWEWIDSPEAVRWWRRAASGNESLCGMALVVRRSEVVELYGLVEIDELSPYWTEVIPEAVAGELPGRAKFLARQHNRSEKEILAGLYREYFRQRGMLTVVQKGQPALRKGTIREVERFRDALKGLVERAAKAQLPSEVNQK